ncbi:MAG: hypothetical protein VX100_17650 [Pseudomonadota bacterium]|nr:hypothetical protein [Pseudomonadota bacterium]
MYIFINMYFSLLMVKFAAAVTLTVLLRLHNLQTTSLGLLYLQTATLTGTPVLMNSPLLLRSLV